MGKNNKPYTTESFKQKLKELSRNDIEITGEYVNNKTKIRAKCTNPECGYEWEVIPSSILNGSGCPKCAIKRNALAQRKTNEQFIKEFKEKGNPNVVLLSKYETNKTPIKCTCKIHEGTYWYSMPQSLLKGGPMCPICGKENLGMHNHYDNEEFLKKFKENGNKDVILLTEYKKYSEKILCQCKKDSSHIWETFPDNLLRGKGCPYCAKRKINETNCFAHAHPELVEYLEDKELAYKYGEHSGKEVVVVCPNCHTRKETTFSSLSDYGIACPMCGDNISYPNKFIRNMLDMLGIDFNPEWTNEKCKGCYYDVEFELNNDIYLIEMDGILHFSEGGYGNLKSVQEKDNIKNQKAKENGWKLIRIKADVSDPEYLYNNIINSELGDLFNLENFNYIECGKRSEKSLMIEVCDYINENITITITEMAKIFKLNAETIRSYIKRGKKLGIVSEAIKRKNGSKFISVVKNGKIIKTYFSATECANNLFSDFGIEGIDRNKISKMVNKDKNIEGYSFIYVKTKKDIASDFF